MPARLLTHSHWFLGKAPDRDRRTRRSQSDPRPCCPSPGRRPHTRPCGTWVLIKRAEPLVPLQVPAPLSYDVWRKHMYVRIHHGTFQLGFLVTVQPPCTFLLESSAAVLSMASTSS